MSATSLAAPLGAILLFVVVLGTGIACAWLADRRRRGPRHDRATTRDDA